MNTVNPKLQERLNVQRILKARAKKKQKQLQVLLILLFLLVTFIILAVSILSANGTI